MKITNHYNIPEPILRFARSDKYSKGDADISVTTLISPPRIQKLREIYKDELTIDASERVWSLFGTAVHHILDTAGETPDTVHEERLFARLNGWTISGAVDIQKYEADGSVQVMDYKVCSAWAVMNDKPEWEQQLNCYAWLIRKVKQVPVSKLEVCAFVRDWNRRKAEFESAYPKSPVMVIPVQLWDQDRADEYVLGRVWAHQDAQQRFEFEDPLPLCNDQERWMKPSKWALMKDGRKSAVKLFDSETEAMLYKQTAKDGDALFIDHRKGEFTRCEGNFCGVAEFCDQYKGDSNV